MSKSLVTRKSQPAQNMGESTEIETSNNPTSFFHPFCAFQYTYSEISRQQGKTVLKSVRHRFEDGKLKSETFSGTMDCDVYNKTAAAAHEFMAVQTALMLKQMSLFLSFIPARKKTKTY